MKPAVRTTLVFGLISALVVMPATAFLSAAVGWPLAFRLVLWIDLFVYAGLLTRWSDKRPHEVVFPATLLLGAALWPGTTGIFFFLGVGVLSWIRSGICFTGRPLRGIVAELLTLLGGVGLVALVKPGSTVAWAIAVWLFFLVQALYFFIVPMPRRQKADLPPEDRFEEASRRARRLLEASE